MQTSTGIIQEISLRADGQHAAWVSCPTTTLPEPGQYLSAWAHDDPLAPLATTLFAGALMNERFLALPHSLQPGSPAVDYPYAARWDMALTCQKAHPVWH